MNREEITNSQDYKATKAALEWWYSLPEEQRKATDIDAIFMLGMGGKMQTNQ